MLMPLLFTEEFNKVIHAKRNNAELCIMFKTLRSEVDVYEMTSIVLCDHLLRSRTRDGVFLNENGFKVLITLTIRELCSRREQRASVDPNFFKVI